MSAQLEGCFNSLNPLVHASWLETVCTWVRVLGAWPAISRTEQMRGVWVANDEYTQCLTAVAA